MIEFRLCSIALARWLDAREKASGLPAPPVGMLGMFGRLEGATAESPIVLLSRKSPLASVGIRFESSSFVISVAHALGAAAAATGIGSEEVLVVEHLAASEGGGDIVPMSLSQLGVTAILPKAQAAEVAAWMRRVDKDIFEEEVASMFGADAVVAYAAAARDLQRTFNSVLTHDADLCVRSGDVKTVVQPA